MIKYTTKDIVNRATQLADLENSDFISWNENINLLNESWQKIYQQLIDNGDKTFIKEFETVASNKIKLPCDFYQLFAVELVPSCRQVLRKAKSESEFSLTYDIENNYLILYGTVSEKLRIKYIPTPQTLTLKNDTKDINSDFNKLYQSEHNISMLDCFKNKYLYSDIYNQTNKVYIFNKDTSEIKEMADDFTPTVGIIGNKNIIACTTFTQDYTPYSIYIINNNGTRNVISIDSSSTACLLKRDKDVGVVKVKGTVVTVYINDNIYSYDISERINEDEIENIVLDGKGIATFNYIDENYMSLILPTFDGNKNKWIQLDIDNTKNFSVNETIPFENFDFGNRNTYKRYSNIINGNVCISTKDMFYLDKYALFSDDENELIGINELNNDNGYGISIIDKYETNHILLHSWVVDTLLLYPNNVYFNFMSMLLAISYKIKQNADITVLSSKYGEMEAQYFDSLTRDINNVVRITNVY